MTIVPQQNRSSARQEVQKDPLIRRSQPQPSFQQRDAFLVKERGNTPKPRLVVQNETFFRGEEFLGTHNVQSNPRISRSDDLEHGVACAAKHRPYIEVVLPLGDRLIHGPFRDRTRGIAAIVHGLTAVSDCANIVLCLAGHIVAYREQPVHGAKAARDNR